MKRCYIYKFIDKFGKIIYIGRTYNLKVRINSHFSNGHLDLECYDEVEFIEFAEIPNEADMYILEIYLISKYSPKYNSQYKNMECSFMLEEPTFYPYNRVIKCSKAIKTEKAKKDLINLEIINDNILDINKGNLNKTIKLENRNTKIFLMKRDMLIIEFILKNNNYVETSEIYEKFFKGSSIRSCQRRLQKLVDIGLVTCNRENILSPNLYFISIKNFNKYKEILLKNVD